MDKTTKEILDIFGEYHKAISNISEYISRGETKGSFEWFFFREDYDEVSDEMEEVFDGENFASIVVNWSLSIN